jgi:hypothetical protein
MIPHIGPDFVAVLNSYEQMGALPHLSMLVIATAPFFAILDDLPQFDASIDER